MTKASKRVRIVGKGHASCYERLLEEWFREEKFIDVILKCSNPEENLSAEFVANLGLDSRSGDLCRDRSSEGVQANRSVLAAASSVFRDVFLLCPLVEEDVRITLVGYSARALKAVVEYIYTGSLEFVTEDKSHVEAILHDFRIQAPTTSEKLAPTTSTEIFHQLLPIDEPSPVLPLVINSPRKRVSERFDPKIVSTMSVASNRRANILRRPAVTTIVESHVQHSTSPDLNHSIPLALNLVQRSPQKLPIPRLGRQLTGYTTAKTLPPSKIAVPPPTSPQDPLLIHPVVHLKRSVDVPVARKEESTYDPPATGTPLALRKSFPEKTFINCPPFKTRVKETPKSVAESSVGFNSYRRSVSALVHEVPGIYTTWKTFVREKPMPIVEKVYMIPPDPLSTHFYVPSFVKQVSRTYQDKPTGRIDNIKATERLSMKGYTIDSVHEVSGKVHIRTVGFPPVSKESEELFNDDTPISSMDPEGSTQRTLVNTYSGWAVSQDTEEAKVDYKRSLTLVSYQKRINRKLKDRLEKMQKTTKELKKNARILLGVCESMKDEAHESDPDYVEPTPKVVPKPKPVAVEKLPCDVCNKLIKKSWIRQHKLQCHTTERNHLCDECGRSYALKRQLSSHKALHHRAPGNFQCEQCGQTFKYVRYLKRHMSFHMNEKPHECKFCDKKFRLKQTLVKHLRVHTGEKPYQCKVCERRFSQRTAYVTHTKIHERAIASGKIINPGAGCHRNHHTGPRENLPLLKCDYCSMTFRLELFMKLHLSKHTGEPPALPCPTCKQTFPTIRGLANHRKTEHPETVFACTQCPKIFTNKTNLEFHVKTHTDPNAPKKKYPLIAPKPTGPCPCDFCGKIFKNRTSLDYHIKGIHLGSKLLKCAHCEKMFGNRTMLEQHLQTHTSERPYKCDECPSSFEKSKELEAHMAVHSGDLSQIPFACTHCDKTFALKASLYSHMRIHTGKKLFCSHCDKVFPNIPQLMQHEDECPMNDENNSSASSD